jgi:hypothetical protein
MRILGSIVLILCCWTSRAEAACSGGGLTWTCTSGSTLSNIQSAYNAGSDGMTITLQNGTYSFGNSALLLSNTKGLTLICQSVQGCTISHNEEAVVMTTLSGTNTRLYRISGFVWNGSNAVGGTGAIWLHGYDSGGTAARTMTQLRIDHNRFQGYPSEKTIIYLGEIGHINYFYGLIDNNTVTSTGSVALGQVVGGTDNNAPTGTRGTANNLYFENNTITITTMTNAGLGCMDSWGGASVVWRYNTTTNCLLTSHGVTHSWGPVNWEVYGNQFVVDSGADSGFQDCYRCFHHQGAGEFLAFDNVFTAVNGKSGDALEMTHYRSAVSGSGSPRCNGTVAVDGNRPGQLGYPCNRQPGRDANRTLQPMYVWSNRWSDTLAKIDMAVENPWSATNPSVADHVAANRDYYNAVSASAQNSSTSPFNGTTGMGFGILARRPTTCTPTPQSADANNGGVGYWATDQGEWNSTQSGADGRLYRCSATNTWTLHYMPYTYPHPLASGSQSQAPAAPSNPRITRQ